MLSIIYLLYFISICGFILITGYVIWFMIILVNSNFFQISPTISSGNKSIKTIAHYIKNYITENNIQQPNILDIGSGYGKLLFGINKIIPEGNYTGYEISKLSYRVSMLKNKHQNITFINDNIVNIKNFNFNIIVTFLFLKQQKDLIQFYNKCPLNTLIISNSFEIPFTEEDCYDLIETKTIYFRWTIYIYKKTR